MASQIVVANNAVTPSAPIVGQTTLYVKTDGNLYKQDSNSVESLVGGSTGATGGGTGNTQDHIFNQTDQLVTNDWTVGEDVMSIFTVTVANPATFSLTSHGFVAGQPLNISTTGALPTGLSASTQYFVIASGLTADAFQVSATVGGTAVVTTGTQSGVHSVGKTKDALITKELTVLTGKSVVVPTGASLIVVGAGNPDLGDLYVNTSSAQTIAGDKTFTGLNTFQNKQTFDVPSVNAANPCFRAYQNVLDSIVSGADRLISFQVKSGGENFDTTGCFNNTSSTVGTAPAYSFNPQVAGYYLISGSVGMASNSYYAQAQVYKNGVAINNGIYGLLYILPLSPALVYLNGSTDYIQIKANSATTQNTNPSTVVTYFQAALISRTA